MKSLPLGLSLLAILFTVPAGFVACGADTDHGTASGGTPATAGNGATSGSASAGGGMSNSGGTASPPGGEGGAAALGGAGALGGAAAASGAGPSGGAAAGGAEDGGAAGAGGAPSSDRCGGCKYDGVTPQICIFQAGGPGAGRFVCATQNPCGAAGACACIVGQGTCNSTLEGGSPGYCVCDNGLD